MKKIYISFILLFVLSGSIFSHESFAADGLSVLNDDSIIAGYLDWGYLYKHFMDNLKNINNPRHALTKSMLERFCPNTSSQTAQKPFQVCANKMRRIIGAIEMHNMDNDKGLKHLDFDTLKEKGYLSDIPVCPSNGVYSYNYDQDTIICSKHGDMKNPTPCDDDLSAPQGPSTAAELAETILDWSSRGVFNPDGRLWLSISNNLQPRLILEGTYKPSELIETIKSILPGFPEPEILQTNLVRFKFAQTPMGIENLILEILPNAIKAGSNFSTNTYNTGWEELISSAQSQKMKLAVEFNGDKLLLNAKKVAQKDRAKTCLTNLRILQAACEMYGNSTHRAMKNLDQKKLIAGNFLRFPVSCPDHGRYSISGNINKGGVIKCSIHGTSSKPRTASIKKTRLEIFDSKFKYIKNIRLLIGKDKSAIRLKISNSTLRDEFKAMLDKEGQNKFGKSQLKSPFSKQLQQIAELEKNVRVIENGEQLEFLYDELGLDALITILSGGKK